MSCVWDSDVGDGTEMGGDIDRRVSEHRDRWTSMCCWTRVFTLEPGDCARWCLIRMFGLLGDEVWLPFPW